MCVFLVLFLIPWGVFLYRVHAKVNSGARVSRKRIDGKVIVVTGDYFAPGLPYETVKELAARGGKVIFGIGTHLSHGESAIGVIKEKIGDHVQIEVKYLRLESLSSVREFCSEVLAEESRLDVLIHNPGPKPERRARKYVTEDGLESTFAANYFGQFLVTHLLLGLMSRTKGSRIINVSSGTHHFARTLDLDNLHSEKSWAPSAVYAKAKLAQILFTRELHRRLYAADIHTISVNALHSGSRKGNFCRGKKKERTARFWRTVKDMLFQNVEESAETTIHLAVADEVEGVSGVYWVDCQPASVSTLAQDLELGKRLWEKSVTMVGLRSGESILLNRNRNDVENELAAAINEIQE